MNYKNKLMPRKINLLKNSQMKLINLRNKSINLKNKMKS